MEYPNVLTKPWVIRNTMMRREGTRRHRHPAGRDAPGRGACLDRRRDRVGSKARLIGVMVSTRSPPLRFLDFLSGVPINVQGIARSAGQVEGKADHEGSDDQPEEDSFHMNALSC